MDSSVDSGTHISDHRFIHLVAWEARLLGWGRRLPLRIVMVLLVVAAAMPCMWRFAIEPEPLSPGAMDLNDKAVLLLAGTPLHSARQTLTEMSFAYILLHLSVYLAVGFAMLLLPGIAAAGVARDRRTGRLGDLITTTFSSTSIYAAKVFAAALPFSAAGGSVFVLMLPIIFAERLDAGSVMRILFEMILQIGLIAAVSVTSSCLRRHATTARVLAYLGVWIVLPMFWYCVAALGYSQGHIHDPGSYPLQGRNPNSPYPWTWTWEQFSNNRILFQCSLGLLTAVVGVRRIFPRSRVRRAPTAAAPVV